MTLPSISHQIWDKKYRLRSDREGIPSDSSVQDTWLRIAKALSMAEDDHEMLSHGATKAMEVEELFFRALDDYKFLPAGRITAGAGSGRNVTLFNCYVMGTIPDDMGGIFDMLKEAALTMQQGGGIGYDFSTLRPKGATVKGVAADASGPITFMDVWDSMCKTIMSAGSRRGAMMATMMCDHPDIVDFIKAKNDPDRLRMFNLSVMVTDEFMDAVRGDHDWFLVHEADNGKRPSLRPGHEGKYPYGKIRARELWDLIMQSTYDQAEPGVVFIDKINRENNLKYCETIRSLNPCGEQPLPPYGACLLGSLNLAKFVRNAFLSNSVIDMDSIQEVVAVAVRMLDNVIDVSNFPLPSQEKSAKDKRRIGLGVTGLADALAMLGVKYGSDEAVLWTDTVMKHIAHAAYAASVELAKEKGPFPAFTEEYLDSEYVKALDPQLQAAIRKDGIRNSHLISIAPTGTVSLYAGNVSSGIEPIFAPSYTRTVLNDDGTKRQELVEDYAVRLYRDYWLNENNPSVQAEYREFNQADHLPPYFVSAQTLTPMEHLRMQAAAQKWVDSAISKTINCPEDISFDDFKQIYMDAWKMGCKGCTTYRPNEITGSVLSLEESEKPEREPQAVSEEPAPRPEELDGTTYKLRWQGNAVYVTINDHVGEDGVRRPMEMFINSKNMEHYAWTVALTRMVSAVFRRGGDVSFVAEELRSVFDPRGGQHMGGAYVPSLLAAIGDVLRAHMGGVASFPTEEPDESLAVGMAPKQCPECGAFGITMKEGCETCKECGHSKCG